jgi:hypothetical protein
MLNIALIKSRIAARAEEFLRELFGERLHRAGSQSWRVGKKGSLAIEFQDGELVFFDHEAGQGGDCIALWQRERGGTFKEALSAAAAWAGVSDDGTYSAPPAKSPPAPVDRDAHLDQRPPHWPMMDQAHDALWRSGVERLELDAAARQSIAEWRGWPEFCVRVLARAGLISAPVFDLWPTAIAPQSCVCFPVLHAEHTTDGSAESWAWRPVQLHVRFHPGATRREGSPLSWIYAPTMKQIGIKDGGNAPFIIARDGRDPEQPGIGGRCRCVIITAGEWDALTFLLAAWWLDDNGTLMLPRGLAICGIRGEGRSGTDAYLRHCAHWRPDSVILLADADRTGLAWFKPSPDGRPGFAEQLEKRGAKVIPRVPSGDGVKDVSDLYRAGLFGLPDVEDMLTAAGFDWNGGTR